LTFEEKVFQMRNNGLSWREISDSLEADFPELTYQQRFNKARNIWRRKREIRQNTKIEQTERIQRKSHEVKADGSRIFEDILTIMENENDISPEEIIESHKLNPRQWEVLNYKTNFWQAQAKDDKKMLLYQSKLTVKPKTKIEITFEDIDNYFEAKDYSKDKLSTCSYDYDPEGEILEIKVPDLHIGLLAWREETGADYDLKIVKQRFFQCINDILERCKDRKFKKIVFVTLGDLLHVDNDRQETTNGTFQQVDGRIAKITECAEDLIIDTLTMLGDKAPVEYIYLCGNHDRTVGYMLARSVSNAFRNDKNVTCDISPNPIKYRRYGVSLVVYHHGDAPKKNIAELPMKYAREELAYSKFVEINLGHYHDEDTKSINGARVRYFPTICSSSYWEHQQGYQAPIKAIVCDIRNENTGLRDTWYSMV